MGAAQSSAAHRTASHGCSACSAPSSSCLVVAVAGARERRRDELAEPRGQVAGDHVQRRVGEVAEAEESVRPAVERAYRQVLEQQQEVPNTRASSGASRWPVVEQLATSSRSRWSG